LALHFCTFGFKQEVKWWWRVSAPSVPIGIGRDSRIGKGKQFFFGKKNQKTFVYKACALPQRARQWTKVFASFFKKKCFLRCGHESACAQ
jgi:hypothetical protein